MLEVSDPLKLKLQVVVSSLMWLLRKELFFLWKNMNLTTEHFSSPTLLF